jgi:N-acetylmuramoyl-L-alanine amidase
MDGDIELPESGGSMGRAPLALVAVLSILVPDGSRAASTHRAGAVKGSPRSAGTPGAKRAAPRRARPPTLAEAQATLKALMRDRTRRRFHHQWERAIRGLLAAARGKDAQAATLEAARARYALYRWSANEADREEALRLAARAAKLGSREARVLAKAIRREAGEERPVRRSPVRQVPGREARPEPAEEDSAIEPALEAVLADLKAQDEGSPRAPALPLGSDGGEGRAHVSAVRTWASEDYTRVAIYLSHWVGWQKLELPSELDRPRRIALDFRPAVLDGSALARTVPGVQVDRVRAAQHDPDTVRVVLDLPGTHAVQAFTLDDPPRLVLDVGAAGRGARGIATSTSPPTPTPTPVESTAARPEPVEGSRPSVPTPNATAAAIPPSPASTSAEDEATGPVRRIVVDAGHGGHDPGAIGPRRVREKDVTLAIARRLAKRLRADGFQVVLTRNDDRYLALEERTALANTARGDLFVSIHANAHPRRNRSGVETYFLNVADDRYAARLAARENGIDLDAEGEAVRILTDLDAKASAEASLRLARLVQREVTSGVRERVGEVRDLGVKSALFYVLLGARMPAVLVETAFISNRDEERRLASARYQEEVAGGVARAVASFARSAAQVADARTP